MLPRITTLRMIRPATRVTRPHRLARHRPAKRLPRRDNRLMNLRALQTALDGLGAEIDLGQSAAEPVAQPGKDQPVIATYSRAVLRSRSSKVLRRRMPDDAAATAQQLFAVLREFDVQGVKLIWIEAPPDTPDWDGVRDRLQRASAA